MNLRGVCPRFLRLQAYLFFVPFIAISVFAVLNLFIAVLTNSMQEVQKEELQAEEQIASRHQQELMAEIERLRLEMRDLRSALATKPAG